MDKENNQNAKINELNSSVSDSTPPQENEVDITWDSSLYIEFKTGSLAGNTYKVQGESVEIRFWVFLGSPIKLIKPEIRDISESERTLIIETLRKYPKHIMF